jgi:hypothetical protein
VEGQGIPHRRSAIVFETPRPRQHIGRRQRAERIILAVAGCAAACTGSNELQRPTIDVFLGRAPVWVAESLSNSRSTLEIPAMARVIGTFDTHLPSDPAYPWGAYRQQPAPASWPSIVARAKDRARDLGGDALVIGTWSEVLEGDTSQASELTITIIRYGP